MLKTAYGWRSNNPDKAKYCILPRVKKPMVLKRDRLYATTTRHNARTEGIREDRILHVIRHTVRTVVHVRLQLRTE